MVNTIIVPTKYICLLTNIFFVVSNEIEDINLRQYQCKIAYIIKI